MNKYEVDFTIKHCYVDDIISKHRQDLAEARIITMFRNGDWTSQRQTVWGKVDKVNDKTKALLGENEECDFIITINRDIWEMLNEDERMALIDHELGHCWVAGTEYKIAGHDIEDFHDVIRRHGRWNKAVERTIKAHEDYKNQLTLFDNVTPIDRRATGE